MRSKIKSSYNIDIMLLTYQDIKLAIFGDANGEIYWAYIKLSTNLL